jgi:large subunit ribosomal protein L6e
MRRVNQAYVIATSLKIDLKSVKLPAIEDDYFSRSKDPETKGSDEDKFFAAGKGASAVSEQRKKDQEVVDGALIKKLDEMSKSYLKAKFSLTKGQRPHEMKF